MTDKADWKVTSNGETARVGRFTVRVFPDGTWTAYDSSGTRVDIRDGRIGEKIYLYSDADWNDYGFRAAAFVDEAKAEAIRVMTGPEGQWHEAG